MIRCDFKVPKLFSMDIRLSISDVISKILKYQIVCSVK